MARPRCCWTHDRDIGGLWLERWRHERRIVAVVQAGGDTEDGRSRDAGHRVLSDKLDVEAGETVQFVFHNTGKIAHDAFVGGQAAQEDHEMKMREAGSNDMSGMSHGSSDAEGGITVDPGQTKELTHTFTSGDGTVIGCHQVGHYAGGMKININTD